MLPRMLFNKEPGSGQCLMATLEERMAMFSRRDWIELIGASQSCDERAAVTRRRRQRRADNVEVKRAARGEMFVHMGELSSTRQAWVGEVVSLGNQATDNQVTDDTRRLARPRDPLPDEILNFQPTVSLDLDEDKFCSSRKGAAAGPSGMTTEHLRPLFLVAEAQILDIATRMIRVGRFTALSKPDGGVRGIVAGDVIRRLVARTMAQQSQKAVEVATALFHYALSTVAHALPGLTKLHLDTTIKSIDGISAFDLISRESILTGLTRVDRSQAALPLVRLALVACRRASLGVLRRHPFGHCSSPSWSCVQRRAAGVVDPRRHPCSHQQDQGVEQGRHQTNRVQRFGENCSHGEPPRALRLLCGLGSGIPSHQ